MKYLLILILWVQLIQIKAQTWTGTVDYIGTLPIGYDPSVIETISGSLNISGDFGDSLSHFSNLKTITGSLKVTSTGLEKLAHSDVMVGLWQLENVAGQHISIINNPELIEAHLPALEPVSLSDVLKVDSNQVLQSIQIPAVFAKSLSVVDNDALLHLHLQGLEGLNRHMTIVDNENLMTIDVSNIIGIVDKIVIENNPSLTTLNSPKYDDAGIIDISENPNLINVLPWNNLAKIHRQLSFSANGVTQLDFYPTLDTVGEFVKIEDNAAMMSITFNDLKEVGSDYYGLSEALRINSNSVLENFKFPSLARIRGTLELSNNLILEEGTGPNSIDMMALKEIKKLSIINNDKLKTLNWLASLPVDGITGLLQQGNIVKASIWENATLAKCSVDALCDAIQTPSEVIAYSNLGCCEDTASIIEDCANNCFENKEAQAEFVVEMGDLYVGEACRGIILKNPEGDCFRLSVDSAGTLNTTPVTCPN